MITVYIIFSLISISVGLDVKIGGLFDNNANDSKRIFECAVEVANKEILVESKLRLNPQSIEIMYGHEFGMSKTLCKLLKAGIGAVFGPTSPSVSSHCMSICDAKEIPYIDVKWDEETKPPVINMHPHPDAVAEIFVNLTKVWDWKGFTIIYESAPWLPRVMKLLTLFDPKVYTITVRRLNVGLDGNNFKEVLRRVKLSGDTHIILDCSIETLPEVLKQAQQVGLMTDYHQFIITTMDFHTIDLEPYQYSGTNITGIRLVDPENPLMRHITSFMEEGTESDDEESETSMTPETMNVQTALIFDGVLLLAEALKQLDISQIKPKMLNCNSDASWENGNTVMNFMRNTITQGLTGDIKFDNKGYRTEFTVDIVELTSSGIAKFGTWDSTHGVNISRSYEAPAVIDDGSLKNKMFIVLTTLTKPYGMLKNSSALLSGNDRYEGFGVDLIHELSLMLGFQYEFRLQVDGAYGSINNDTKEWTGMIRELLDWRADLAITDLTITAERESGADFTMPFMNLGISILLKRPTKEAPSTFSFMSPFSTEVWMYLGAAYLGVSFCLFILGRLSPSEWDNPYPCIEEPTHLENQFTITNALWFSTGALLQQGSEIAPKAPSTRVVASIWWFFTLIMVSSYTANLAAFLSVPNVFPAIKSVEDLKDCHDPKLKCPVKFGAKRDGSTINFFKESRSELYKNMYTYMSNNPHLLTSSNEEGEALAELGDYAFFMESSSIEYIIERNCEVIQIGGLLDDKGYGIAMRKESDYRNALSEGILKLQEQGKLSALKIKWWKEKKAGGSCEIGDGGDAEALDLENLYGVFIVLLVGSAFASLFGIFECIFNIFRRAKRQNVPFKEELKAEIKFISKCEGNTKPVVHRKSTSMDSRHSNESDDRSNASKCSVP